MKKFFCGVFLFSIVFLTGCNETRLRSLIGNNQALEFDSGKQVVVEDRYGLIIKVAPFKCKVGSSEYLVIQITAKNKSKYIQNLTIDQAKLFFQSEGKSIHLPWQDVKFMTPNDVKFRLDIGKMFLGISKEMGGERKDYTTAGRIIEDNNDREQRSNEDFELSKISSILVADTIQPSESVTRYLIADIPKNGSYQFILSPLTGPYTVNFVIEPDKK